MQAQNKIFSLFSFFFFWYKTPADVYADINLYPPDLGQFIQGEFTSQQLNDSFYSLTVLSLVNIALNDIGGGLIKNHNII